MLKKTQCVASSTGPANFNNGWRQVKPGESRSLVTSSRNNSRNVQALMFTSSVTTLTLARTVTGSFLQLQEEMFFGRWR